MKTEETSLTIAALAAPLAQGPRCGFTSFDTETRRIGMLISITSPRCLTFADDYNEVS